MVPGAVIKRHISSPLTDKPKNGRPNAVNTRLGIKNPAPLHTPADPRPYCVKIYKKLLTNIKSN